MNSQKRLLLFELNEFNRELLQEASLKYNLKNIQKILHMQECTTRTEDKYDSGYLEPWVQWVSVHTGAPSTQHHIKHLGDVPHLNTPQVWETLSQHGVSSGIWGVMNGGRATAENCLFFLPDPWTFTEVGYPEDLRQLLELPRHISKNYLNLSVKTVLEKLAKFLSVLGTPKVLFAFIKELPSFLTNLVRFHGAHFVFISFADYLLTCLFLEYRRRYNPQFSVLFLNSLAHIQHHHWYGFDYENNQKIRLGLANIDRILAMVLKDLKPEEAFICLNGLSQTNTNKDKPWILYRQRDQARFLKHVGISVEKVEPHMTHDAHLFFKTEEECARSAQILREANIAGKPLFLVESYNEAPKKLFYRIDFTDKVDERQMFKLNGKEYRFFELFQSIVVRTGKHIQRGTLYSHQISLPKTFFNHELVQHILNYFEIKPSQQISEKPQTDAEFTV